MTYERWLRDGNEVAFDWRRSARELEVPEDIARALYVRAVQRAADEGGARPEELYLRWLRAAALTHRLAARPLATPGRQTRVSRPSDPAGRTMRPRELEALGALGPGKWTRALLASAQDDARLPGQDDARHAMDALVSAGEHLLAVAPPAAGGPHADDRQNDRPSDRLNDRADAVSATRTDAPAGSPAALRAQLIAAVTRGHRVTELLAAADPVTAAAALRELRGARMPGQRAPMLRLVTSAANGEVERVLGRGSASAALPGELATRLAPHVGPQAAGAARLHTDDAAELLTSAHHARALTVGTDIYFARGEYAPGTAHGDELLAHELTHVAQGQRGELSRAAAKGLDSGSTLDPAEAEADLRARLAVIQLHAPEGAAPALAAPAGQPTSAGDRAAKLATQQRRISLATAAAPPLTIAPAPAAASPQAPVPHTPPVMTAPPAAAATGNAYVETFSAPPSKQALALWDQAGAQATTKVAADQAKFDAGLPPMPIVLDGRDAPVKGGGQGAGQGPAKPPVAGATPPGATATPTPPAPAITTAATAARAIQPSADKAQMKADGQKIIDGLPSSSPDVKTDPGPAPVTDLAGQADPVRAVGDHQHAIGETAKALDAAKAKVISGPGAAQVQPAQLDQKLKVPAPQAPGAMPALPTVPGMAKLKQLNLPGNAQAAFDDVARPKMDASLAQAKAKMTEAETKRDADRTKAVTDAQAKVTQAHADADKQQQAKVAESRTKISNHQADTLVKQEAEIKKLDQQSGDKKTATIGKINDRVSADQSKVEGDYKAAQAKADEQKKKGEEDAARKKKEAEDKQKDESWWDKAADAVCDGIKAIADEIDHALEAIGKAIGDILDAVKTAACSLIDAARDFVCQALTELGDWLKSAVTALIGSVFPELAAALNHLIDQAVSAAKAAVTAIADGLKQAVTALCDSLKAAIDAALAAFRAAVQAAATFAQALVTGDWKLVGKMILEGVLKLLGIDPAAFYALIGSAEDSIEKIIENPGAFVGHLIDAVKLGFKQFGANFLTHLKNGVVQWLFGTFAEAGITMPASFDVAGIFDLVCQVLGLTWPRMRGKVVKVIGEKNTERLEFVSQYLQALVTGGFAGLWDKIQQDMSGLWDMVIGGVKSWLIETVVQQAIIKIATMWNPAGAIIQLIQTAWNVYQWVRENAQRIFGLVQAVVSSMANIVAGNIGGAANFIEASLAKLVPIAISLFADLIGLGGIAEKIKGIIEKIQTKIDQAIDKLIDRVLKTFKGKGGKDDADHHDGDHPAGDHADGKDAKGKDGKDGKDGKTDPGKQVGARVSFQAHGETHTQYLDAAGVPMVASTPSAVKAKIAEWRPRLRELPDADQKRAGQLIGKAIAIEGKVSGLATQVKAGKASEADLEAKQRELADTLAGLFEVMAPDLDPSKALSDQDPRATLKSAQYAQFKGRFVTLATSLAMPAGAAAAQELWLKVVTTLQKTDAAYKAAPTVAGSPRKDLSATAFTDIMKDFEPITAAIAPYMEKYAHGKKSWAFWSGKPAVEAAKKHAQVCLENSALGSLFDGININGSWDIQMWASLSKAYATHAAAHVADAKYAGFVGMGSSADQSIFNKIEQPQFVGMLDDKQKASLHVDWYAVAGDPKTDMRQPDWRFHAGGFDGVYATGERGAMVAMAETENKRRLELFKDKGIDEGPGGATTGSLATAPVDVPVDMNGAAHTLTVKPGVAPTVELHSVPGLVKSKAGAATQTLRKQSVNGASAQISALESIGQQATQLETLLKTPGTTKPAIETAARSLVAPIHAYGSMYKASDLDEVGDVTEAPKKLEEPAVAKLAHPTSGVVGSLNKAMPGTIIHQSGQSDPRQATKSILTEFPQARYDRASGTLTLPPVLEGPLLVAASLQELASLVAGQTGVTRVVLEKRGEAMYALVGEINPRYTLVEITNSSGAPIGEFDEVIHDGTVTDRFVEDKNARGLANPRNTQTPAQWAQKQIFDKTATRIAQLAGAANSRPRPDGAGSPAVPGVAELQSIKEFEFVVEATDANIQTAVNATVASLKSAFPDYKFSARFGP